jgi:7-cyano-7-deazaguanine reductase
MTSTSREDYDQRSGTTKLARLAHSVPAGERKLATFDAPQALSEIHLEVEHMTSLCPATGSEDFYTVDIYYAPRGNCLETKSLKEYLASFRNELVSAEVLADLVARELLEATNAYWTKVTFHQALRGGISIHATAYLSHENDRPPTPPTTA